MTQQIADYFKTQPVLKAWLFGSFARGEEVGRKVDLVEEGTLRPAVQKTANRDMKVIYERSN